jgi:hypothetical protein
VLKRLLRVPSFRLAYAVNLLPLLALLCWAFADAHFWNAMRIFREIGHGGRYPDDSFSIAWRMFPDRLLFLTFLITVAVVATVIVAFRLLIGTKRDRSLFSWMLAILLIALWSGSLLAIVRSPDAQLRYRIRRDLWRYRIVADAITSAGKIPRSLQTDIGEITCDTVDTDRWPSYFRPAERTALREEIWGIWTLDDGALLFTVLPGRVALEFHPRGKKFPGSNTPDPSTASTASSSPVTRI